MNNEIPEIIKAISAGIQEFLVTKYPNHSIYINNIHRTDNNQSLIKIIIGEQKDQQATFFDFEEYAIHNNFITIEITDNYINVDKSSGNWHPPLGITIELANPNFLELIHQAIQKLT